MHSLLVCMQSKYIYSCIMCTDSHIALNYCHAPRQETHARQPATYEVHHDHVQTVNNLHNLQLATHTIRNTPANSHHINLHSSMVERYS